MPLNYSLTFLLLLLSLYGFSLDSLRVERSDGKLMVIHEVERGETLYSLSKRYQAEISEITTSNEIIDNTISLGQLLRIPVKDVPQEITASQKPKETIHTVATGETLFSISQQYGLRVYELKEMNSLSGNEIAIGQELAIREVGPREEYVIPNRNATTVTENTTTEASTSDPLRPAKEEEDDFVLYSVQSGDEIKTIADRYGVRVDSVIYWNALTSDHLAIGQEIRLKQKVDVVRAAPKIVKTPYGIKKRIVDQSGFVRIVEEGIALKIEDVIPTDKYLCLHREQPIGSLVEVRNLMNNQKVFVKVVAKLPNTGLNENVLIRITPVAFKRLGIIDPRARVEISYYEE